MCPFSWQITARSWHIKTRSHRIAEIKTQRKSLPGFPLRVSIKSWTMLVPFPAGLRCKVLKRGLFHFEIKTSQKKNVDWWRCCWLKWFVIVWGVGWNDQREWERRKKNCWFLVVMKINCYCICGMNGTKNNAKEFLLKFLFINMQCEIDTKICHYRSWKKKAIDKKLFAVRRIIKYILSM